MGDLLDQVRQGTLSGRPLYSALHLFGEAGYLEARSVIEFLWRGDHVPSVLVGAVRDGLACLLWGRDSFAYADSYDDVAGRYRGLRAAEHVSIPETDPPGLLVKPEVACRQLEAERPVAGAQGTEADRPNFGAGDPAEPSSRSRISTMADVGTKSMSRMARGMGGAVRD